MAPAMAPPAGGASAVQALAAPLALHGDDRALFASDIHLHDADAGTADAFFAALAREAATASHLFLLGDLFEAWVGDDDTSAVGQRLASALAAISHAGTRVYLMRGNRDFLLDVPLERAPDSSDASSDATPFSARCGATMLADPCPAVMFDAPALLAHGDAFCTDDAAYQAFRAQTRSADWQREFLRRPLAGRVASARALRARSESEKADKAEYLMDVNAGAVENAMRAVGARLLIHGHTHRPAVHRFALDGAQAQRWVLPDWDARGARGGMLLATRDGLRPVGHWG